MDTTLPPELWHQVLGYLLEDSATLRAVSATCQLFHSFAAERLYHTWDPQLLRIPDIPTYHASFVAKAQHVRKLRTKVWTWRLGETQGLKIDDYKNAQAMFPHLKGHPTTILNDFIAPFKRLTELELKIVYERWIPDMFRGTLVFAAKNLVHLKHLKLDFDWPFFRNSTWPYIPTDLDHEPVQEEDGTKIANLSSFSIGMSGMFSNVAAGANEERDPNKIMSEYIRSLSLIRPCLTNVQDLGFTMNRTWQIWWLTQTYLPTDEMLPVPNVKYLSVEGSTFEFLKGEVSRFGGLVPLVPEAWESVRTLNLCFPENTASFSAETVTAYLEKFTGLQTLQVEIGDVSEWSEVVSLKSMLSPILEAVTTNSLPQLEGGYIYFPMYESKENSSYLEFLVDREYSGLASLWWENF